MTRSIYRATLLVALLGSSAQAQLGSLIKKATGKLESKVEQKVEPAEPVKPLEGDPLSAQMLDGVLKGLTFELQQQAEALKVKDQQLKRVDEWRAADNAGHDEAEQYTKVNQKVMSCVSEAVYDHRRKNEEAMAQRMVNLGRDPKDQELFKQVTDVMQRYAAASQKSDTEAAGRLMTQLERLLGADPAKDSVAAYQKCGRPPVPPASYVTTARLAKELQDVNEDLRKVEMGLSDRAAATAGVPAEQYFLARERLWAWNTARKQKSGSGGVTKDEDMLFKSRAAEIQKVAKALR